MFRDRDVGFVGERVADRAGAVGFGSRGALVGDIAADGEDRIRDRRLGRCCFGGAS